MGKEDCEKILKEMGMGEAKLGEEFDIGDLDDFRTRVIQDCKSQIKEHILKLF